MATPGPPKTLSDERNTDETYYPNKFSPKLPEGGDIESPPEEVKKIVRTKLPGEGEIFSIPITHLSHCTHEENVGKIAPTDGMFTFQVSKKNPRNNSFKYEESNKKKNKGEKIGFGPSETVLPGYLTWWGISIIPWYNGSSEEAILARETESKLRRREDTPGGAKIYLAPYLQYDGRGCSVYGRNSYTVPLKDLIDSYKQSRKDCITEDEQKVYLKKAGTLLYRYEICYVVLVCMGKDKEHNPDIKSMEGAGQPDEKDGSQVTYFQSNGFIAADGQVINDKKKPIYNSMYPVRATYEEKRTFYSWDILDFAFYYPTEDGRLCVNDAVCCSSVVKHDPQSCHLKSTRPPWSCPDQRQK